MTVAAVPSAASVSVGCHGTITAGGRAVQLTGFGIRKSGAISCGRARRVVRAFLNAKLDDRSERCAGRAENPPFAGCRVGRVLCRATASAGLSGVAPQLCSEGRVRVRFRERDKSTG
jgi:hypothetical protein